MTGVNGLNGFDKRVSFSTRCVVFDNDKLTIAKNIKNISNTTTKFNFVKKVFHAMNKFATLLMFSKTGRIGIENRKDKFVRYADEVSILNRNRNECFKRNNENLKELKSKNDELNLLITDRENLKKTLLNNDVFNKFIHDGQEFELILNEPEKLKKLIDVNKNLLDEIKNNKKLDVLINKVINDNKIRVEESLQKTIDLRNKLIIEEKKIDYFLSLIENENVSFKDRYSFFNYLNELKRAEYFCRQSSDSSDPQLADVFRNIFEERISRVKESDIKKIYNEVINTYHYETSFLKENKNTLANFSSNNKKEKFLSKINFLVHASESHLNPLKDIFKKNTPDKLHEIMHTILNEEYHNSGIIISYTDTKNTWIKEYMNEFYGSERKVIAQSVGTNTEYNIESKKEITTQSVGTNTEYNIENKYEYEDTTSVHSSDASNFSGQFEEIEGLDNILEEFSMELNSRNISNYRECNDAIKKVLVELSILSNIVTESLELPIVKENNLLIPLENIAVFSNIIHSVRNELKLIKPNDSFELTKGNNLYSKVQQVTEDISSGFGEMVGMIESSNSDNSKISEIETSLKNIFNKINTSKVYLKKEMLDAAKILIDTLIKESESQIMTDFSEPNKEKNKLSINDKEIKEYISTLREKININNESVSSDNSTKSVNPLNVKLASKEKYLKLNELIDEAISELEGIIHDDTEKE
ncbi:TPA: hypothetical protein SMT55_000018 [Proteus mirabilis]|nr:hypothetical protein [Proteus mirabilis]HEK2722453.1 hypothetical protein [Proteus mirabilis]